MPRLRCRVDGNQPEFVKALRDIGISVSHTHMVGDGFPDIVCGYGFTTLLVEIKDPSKPPSKQQLTEDEVTFFQGFKGAAMVAREPEEVMAWYGITGE